MRKIGRLDLLFWCWSALYCLFAAVCLSGHPYLGLTDAARIESLLPPPPTDGSVTYRQEMQTVIDAQAALTNEATKRILGDSELSIYRFAGNVLGPQFARGGLPSTEDFFDKVRQSSRMTVELVKQKYKRRRPYELSVAVMPPSNVAALARSPAYPSEHAAFGAEAALLLSQMVPEKGNELVARAREYAQDRIASGAAFPSDCEAGRAIATAIVSRMLRNGEFRADFELAKKEIRERLRLEPSRI